MRTVAISEILHSIEAAAAEAPGGAIAFDGDGTLWSGDIGEDFFAAVIDEGLRDVSHEPLRREAAEANLDASGTPRDVAYRIHHAYLAGTFPEERACGIMAWAAAGWTRGDLDAFAGDVVEKIGLRGRLHGEALRVVEHVRHAGIDVHLVSASPRAVVAQAARIAGIDPAMVVAAQEAYDAAGVVACSVVRPIPYGDGKVRRLRERMGGRPLYAAFGDNAFDVAMLREAAHPVAIRPKQRLIDRAAEVRNLAVLERG